MKWRVWTAVIIVAVCIAAVYAWGALAQLGAVK